jgi:drug/metabolite transporter (DMT)-like permease
MAVGAIGLFAIAFFMNEQLPTVTTRFTFALCVTGFLSTGLGWLLWVYLLDKLNAGMTSMLTLLVPVIALATASWHLGETIQKDDSVGMILILVGLILLTYLGFKSRKQISNM